MSWVIGNSSPTAKSVRLMSTQARTHNGTIITLSTGANDGGENHNDGDEGLTSICARSYHVWIRTRWGDLEKGNQVMSLFMPFSMKHIISNLITRIRQPNDHRILIIRIQRRRVRCSLATTTTQESVVGPCAINDCGNSLLN